MERTLSVNYPVLRQNKGALLNTIEKHHGRKIQHCTSNREARRDRYVDRMYGKESNDCGFLVSYLQIVRFRTYDTTILFPLNIKLCTLTSYKRYLECTLVQWRLSIYP